MFITKPDTEVSNLKGEQKKVGPNESGRNEREISRPGS